MSFTLVHIWVVWFLWGSLCPSGLSVMNLSAWSSALATRVPDLLRVYFFLIFSEQVCPAGVKTGLCQLRIDVAPPLASVTHLAE